jgi:hypothetical protein
VGAAAGPLTSKIDPGGATVTFENEAGKQIVVRVDGEWYLDLTAAG